MRNAFFGFILALLLVFVAQWIGRQQVNAFTGSLALIACIAAGLALWALISAIVAKAG